MTHFIYAYRITTDAGVTENFHSDSDHVMGLELLKAMKQHDVSDTVLISTRVCGPNYRHIGQNRFKHAVKTCMDAYSFNEGHDDSDTVHELE